MYKIFRILLILLSICILPGQTAEELKRFMNTYDKLKTDQKANDIVKKGIESEKDPDDGPVRLLINPGDMTKYYLEKMNVIRNDLDILNRLLIASDSLPPLTHFGYNYFSKRDSIQFLDNTTVSSDYILGYGDEIIISIWGQAEQFERGRLERDGTIFINNVGLLYLGGKTPNQAKSYVMERFSKVYSTLATIPQSTFLEFSIGKIKNINVTVAGNVQFPGSYVINPSMSISNILILAGGVIETGSLRKIMIQRNSEFVDSLDFYPLITGNNISKSISILDGDIIVVPSRGETIAVSGAVLNPAFFEITSGNNIKTVLEYAGGINRYGSNQVIIARYGAPNLYVKEDQFENISLMKGDSLIVPKRLMKIKSVSVSVINRPLIKIPWIERLNFNSILNIVDVKRSNIKNVELVRLNKSDGLQKPYPFDLSQSENFKFSASDHISIQLYEKFISNKTVVVKGEVNSPGTYPLINSNESLNSILNRAGGLQKTSDINNVIVKRDTLIFGSKTGELILSPEDTIIARHVMGTVKVEGEVHNPGNITWFENSVAKDYLDFAGGLTTYGDKKHIVYIAPYGEAKRIGMRSDLPVLPGSIIRVSEKPIYEQSNQNRYNQVTSIVTSLVSLAILAQSVNQ